jgi:hypothetical protein
MFKPPVIASAFANLRPTMLRFRLLSIVAPLDQPILTADSFYERIGTFFL